LIFDPRSSISVHYFTHSLSTVKAMTEETRGWQRKQNGLWLALAALAIILIAAVVPPLVSISRYKSQVAHLISTSLGRPVRLSSVEARLLPRPGFVLTDLIVDEDPANGAEPLLHANTVTASIRLFSLWRGRLEIGRISVDEASVNLVRTPAGHWNVDALFRTASEQAEMAGGAAGARRLAKLPYLEATNSRINFKDGVEKLPFSLVNTDLSFWQANPGDWRIQLRGQPARTDLSLGLADTGTLRLEGSVRQAAELRQMPLHLDVEWREAQFGQLTRLVLGSDAGWRGNLTGELHLEGTPDAAQVKARLRAEGIHRSEFAPVVPLDFDANCAFAFHYTTRAVEKLTCDSPLGNGRVHLAGELPGDGLPRFSVELDKIPAQAWLDALRTVRSGFSSGLVAKGTVSGKIEYAAVSARSEASPRPLLDHGKARPGKASAAAPGPLTGSFGVEGFELSGNGLSTPIQVPKLMFTPAEGSQTLAATVAIPAGGAGPLTVTAQLSLNGYNVTAHGQASIVRAREWAHVAGMADAPALDALAGDPVTVDLSVGGLWLAAARIPAGNAPSAGTAAGPADKMIATDEAVDRLSGTVTLHNSNWRTDYLANHVEISQATLHLDGAEIRWDPVAFSYGPVKGTASLSAPAVCTTPQPCPASFQVEFGELDVSALQAAFLGAHERGTMLSTLIARLRPSSGPAWPLLEGTVKADSVVLGPVTLQKATAALRILQDGAEITGLDAGLLGGNLHAAGTLHAPASNQDKPAYSLNGQFEKINPAALGQLLGMRWSGGTLNAAGKVDLSGFTGDDLSASAKGTLHFEWRHGSVAGAGTVPAELTRFDRWDADAEIANGSLALRQSEVQQGVRKSAVEATVTLAEKPKVAFPAPKDAKAKR
jgi:hypothetical protein